MIATIHLIVGAAIGKYLPNFWLLAFGAGILSHFVLDALPHADPGTLKKPEERGSLILTDLVLIWLDLVLALTLVLSLSRSIDFTPSMLAGAAGGITPDFMHPLYHFVPALRRLPPFSWYRHFHRRIQRTVAKREWVKGALVELIVALVALLLIVR